MVYVDTSVLAAYYCPEAMSGKAEQAILRSGKPAISLLVDVEFHSAVARKIRDGSLTRNDATSIITRFRLHLDEGYFERIPLAATHYEIAREWVGLASTPLRSLDALHLAVCFEAEAVLLTADASLAKAARHFRVPTRAIEESKK